ncbi:MULTISPECIES: glycosyl hydrolase family 8 [Roseomonadaceae]|uniref:cellulase n=1 Tax=Falsiroseomonas oleicola TaxID=2801474 RepID=A0ABS6H4T4_9PROT|nr:glycosyl hydrolase family 8 [Roseomonas oleicola]MBU8543697.1 glycosyl hydrolase family 5 [Roseomonas oleicola]
MLISSLPALTLPAGSHPAQASDPLRVAIASRPEVARDAGDWAGFCRRWLLPEGRIIDSGNRNVSHSEGQGTGLIFAARHSDRSSFERILRWTRGTLRRPGDSLHAWRYNPGAAIPVDDPNNATDGDLLIAWGLLIAHERWGDVAHRAEALAIARDILRLCVLRRGDEALLLPAAYGFRHADHVVLNLSYWLFGALRALEAAMPDPVWRALRETGLRLTRAARFGRWGLPPDWLMLPANGSSPRPAPGWPPRFSWDAVRVPLHLVWGGHVAEPTLRACAEFWGDPRWRRIPAWVDVVTGATAPYAATPGILAIAQLAMAAQAGWGRHEALPRVADATDYYAAKLVLMSHYAWDERGLDMSEEPRRRLRQFESGPGARARN